MSVHTLSRNVESCDTTMAVMLGCVFKYCTSHATLVVSKWLVGSSSSRMSACSSMARASASFIFQPPDRLVISRLLSSSVKPTLVSAASISLSGRWFSRGSAFM
mmetsp:Transcript_33773/g.85514  ORF Transcript_33773/g.85514 Transcript_33773/m.85514 type:complete len:104 (+) Transcript_33773:2143-2454(+)